MEWTGSWAVVGVAVMTTRATMAMLLLTVMSMLSRWRYPLGLPSVVSVCVAVSRFLLTRPYHVRGVGDLQKRVCGLGGGMARLVHEWRTSTLSLPYLPIPCVARACACVGTRHRAYLLFFLRSGSWYACFAAAACTHTMLRSAVLAASCSSCALGLMVCLLCSQIFLPR